MFKLRWLGLALFLLLAACAPKASQWPTAPQNAPYKLGVGDVVAITVFEQTSLSGDFAINDTGHISYPLIGDVKAIGQTTNQLSQTLQSQLAVAYLKNPNVVVGIKTRRPFFIQGAVNNSSSFAYQPRLTIRQAIALAGGFAQGARRNKVKLYRNINGRVEKKTVHLDYPLQPGDTIIVETAIAGS